MRWFFSKRKIHRCTSVLETLSETEMAAHLAISRYGEFELTDAVRPAYNNANVPRRGYKKCYYADRSNGLRLPAWHLAETKAHLLPLFYALVDMLLKLTHGVAGQVVLESSHHVECGAGHVDYVAMDIDGCVLLSYLSAVEDLLLNDGCFGIAVSGYGSESYEVQFDEHKLISVFGDMEMFETVFRQHHVPLNPGMRFINDDEHIHSTSDELYEQFLQLKLELGAEEEIAF